jgi:hypothetical protein
MVDWFRIRVAAYLLLAVFAAGAGGLAHHWMRSRSHSAPVPAASRFRSAVAPPIPVLNLRSTEVRGRVVEIQGSADPASTVMINGERAALIFDHSSFKHFVLVPEGASVVTVTAMNPQGGVNTQQVQVQAQ